MPDTDLDSTSVPVSPLLEDLDVGAWAIKSTTGNVVLDATATAGADVIAKPDATGQFIVRQDGGTPGTDEIQMYHDGSNGYIETKQGYQIYDAQSGNGHSFYIGGVQQFYFNSDGIKCPVSTFDIGSLTAGFRDLHLRPSASITPTTNGYLTIEATSNTQLTFKFKGSDGTVRTNTLTLA